MELFQEGGQTDGQRDRYDEINSCFWQFRERG